MSNSDIPVITADDRGIWRRTGDSVGHGIEWSEIVRVSGAKLDCVTQHRCYLELDFEFGEFVELYDDWDGFDSAVAALAQRFDLPADWFARVSAMAPEDAPIEIWTRS